MFVSSIVIWQFFMDGVLMGFKMFEIMYGDVFFLYNLIGILGF